MSGFDVSKLKRSIRDVSNTDRFIDSVRVNRQNTEDVSYRIYERSTKGSISFIMYLEDIFAANADLFNTLDYSGKSSSINYILGLLEEEFEGIEVSLHREINDHTLFNNILLEFNWGNIYDEIHKNW